MQKSFTRLSLATALLMGAALPVFAQGTSAAPVQGSPAQRPAVTSSAPAIPGATPGAAQAVRPTTPAPMPSGGTQAVRPATPAQPGAAVQTPATPRPGASRTTTGNSHHARDVVRHGHRAPARVS